MWHDFFAISNGLAGVHKNAKICLYCIRHGDSSFLGNFLWFFTCRVNDYFYQNMTFHRFSKNAYFSKFNKNSVFIKMMKNDSSWNLTFNGNYTFTKNVISLNFVKVLFSWKVQDWCILKCNIINIFLLLLNRVFHVYNNYR